MKPLFAPPIQKDEPILKVKKPELKVVEEQIIRKNPISVKNGDDSWDAIPAFLRRSRKL